MSDEFEHDELLRRLEAEDPASRPDQQHPEPPGERDAVRSRIARKLEADARPRAQSILRSIRPRLAIGAALVTVALGVGLSLIIGGSSSGPTAALAIDKGPRWVTLTLKDPSASDAQMNQELADAGIDRVRVHSVPGSPKGVGTWAGWTEFQPRCKGWSGRFGAEVDMPISHPYNRANRHGAEGQFNLTIPSHSGALYSQEVGTPYSKSIARLPTDSVHDPRSAAKVLIAIRPSSPDDAPNANDFGPDQLVALGGVFAQYGNAIKSGQTSCPDFGLKPEPKPTYTFPPPGNGWVVLHVSGTEAGAARMERELKAGHIKGVVRLIPARPDDVGHWLGFERVPPLPKRLHAVGNKVDIALDDPPGNKKPGTNDIALRRSAFNAFRNARWVFYVGRALHPGESPQLLGLNGPENAAAALKRGCPDLITQISPGGHKACVSTLRLQLPAP